MSWIQSLIRELRSHKPHGTAKQTKTKNKGSEPTLPKVKRAKGAPVGPPTLKGPQTSLIYLPQLKSLKKKMLEENYTKIPD